MKPREHVAKGDRLVATIQKLDPVKHFAMIIENCMNAGTHYLNAAFRPPLELFSNKPSPGMAKAMDALAFIEGLRLEYVRGAGKYDADLMKKCMDCFEESTNGFLKIVGDERKVPVWANPPYWAAN
jgi:hypothetical protein